MTSSRNLTAALVLCSLLVPAAASADRAAEARFHDEAARRHYSARRYEDAARSFMLEQRLSPNPNIVFNIALCMQQLRRHADAYMYFAEYLASDDPDETRRTQSQEALQRLRPHVSLVRVVSEPPGAAIFVDRRELGQYGVTPRVLALAAGTHRIWVERDGYRPDEQTVALELGGESRVALSPTQILGRLRILSPTAAQVRILNALGGVVVEGVTPFDEELPPGTYEAEATAGDERWSEPVTVRASETSEARAALTGPTGAATVTANVVGALVSLDGAERGFTPQVLPGLSVGEHEIEVRADGMQTYRGPLTVAEDDHSWITVDLSVEGGAGVEPATWAFGGLTLAAAIAAAVTTGFAADAHGRFVAAQNRSAASAALADESTQLNIASDVLWVTAGALAVTAIILLITTSEFDPRPSRASVSQENR